MKDNELIELAALAAEIDFRWDGKFPVVQRKTNGLIFGWNPLTNNGDAFFLMAKLGIFISFLPVLNPKKRSVTATLWRVTNDYQDDNVVKTISINGLEIEEATRRAITECAAELGKNIKK
jgi:hypothetical protein